MLPFDSSANTSSLQTEIEDCLRIGRETAAAVAAGERLIAARRAVELAAAYDRLLEKMRLVPPADDKQQRMRGQLAPVRELLRKYRLR